MISRLYRRAQEFLLPLYGGLLPIRLEDIINTDEQTSVTLADWNKDLGAGTLWDLFAICLITKVRSPPICFEIGTGHGRTTLHLALNSPKESEIFTLDISTDPIVGSIFRDHIAGKAVHSLVGDSKTFDFTPWKSRVDLVLVDGNHEYEAVMRDTAIAFELVSPDGCILWDDFTPGWPGVVQSLRETAQKHKIRRIVGTKLAYFAKDL
ncbi:class I SAM-dependent methyltransferase [Nodularia harveyana UHCC-0300]|uniref:Class I SAM-dependent methyltransferase n=1 Tax=Nodularia harveyana UHCC-0300 TaxID=2974287 RepID=A0ABU5UD73_9CYAN|nr:class I SAM-dependent methyltransferase [Nodularia harveyana]MEA5581268.1 class I SAM-dependent methyltransferase [Nodularia harveyana UHCC-0300]